MPQAVLLQVALQLSFLDRRAFRLVCRSWLEVAAPGKNSPQRLYFSDNALATPFVTEASRLCPDASIVFLVNEHTDLSLLPPNQPTMIFLPQSDCSDSNFASLQLIAARRLPGYSFSAGNVEAAIAVTSSEDIEGLRKASGSLSVTHVLVDAGIRPSPNFSHLKALQSLDIVLPDCLTEAMQWQGLLETAGLKRPQLTALSRTATYCLRELVKGLHKLTKLTFLGLTGPDTVSLSAASLQHINDLQLQLPFGAVLDKMTEGLEELFLVSAVGDRYLSLLRLLQQTVRPVSIMLLGYSDAACFMLPRHMQSLT